MNSKGADVFNNSIHEKILTPPQTEDKHEQTTISISSSSAHSEHNTPSYIESLKEERKLLSSHSELTHVFDLIDKEIKRLSNAEQVEAAQAAAQASKDPSLLSKTFELYPNYHFVGHILGPRGTTAKQLETATGCKIIIHGRKASGTGSSVATANEPLSVELTCSASLPDAAQKLEMGVSVIEGLLVPPADGQDELKRQQLMILANMNGTYRSAAAIAAAAANSTASGGVGDYQFENLLPFGYRLPTVGPNCHHEKMVKSLLSMGLPNSKPPIVENTDCSNPRCAVDMDRIVIEGSLVPPPMKPIPPQYAKNRLLYTLLTKTDVTAENEYKFILDTFVSFIIECIKSEGVNKKKLIQSLKLCLETQEISKHLSPNLREDMLEATQESIDLPEQVEVSTGENGRQIARVIKSSQVKHTVQTQSIQNYIVDGDQVPVGVVEVERSREQLTPIGQQAGTSDKNGIVETQTRTMTYEAAASEGGVPPPGWDEQGLGEYVSSKSVTQGNRTIETITYKTEKDGIIETHVEHRVTIHSDGDIDHDAELSQAILEATQMNPDMVVEKIEVRQESTQ